MKKIIIGFVLILSVAMASNAYAADAQNGKRVFDVYCKGCHRPLPKGEHVTYGRHGTDVEPPNGTFTLQQRYKGRVPAALEERTDLTPGFIKTVVRHGMDTKKEPTSLGTKMPGIRKTEVSDEELDDIVAYLTKSKK